VVGSSPRRCSCAPTEIASSSLACGFSSVCCQQVVCVCSVAKPLMGKDQECGVINKTLAICYDRSTYHALTSCGALNICVASTCKTRRSTSLLSTWKAIQHPPLHCRLPMWSRSDRCDCNQARFSCGPSCGTTLGEETPKNKKTNQKHVSPGLGVRTHISVPVHFRFFCQYVALPI
jgi:hypothetical protein